MADSSLNRISTILGILGGSLGLIATVVTAYDKVYVEPAQNISQINKSISTMKKNTEVIINRIKEINQELGDLRNRVLELEENKVTQSSLEKITSDISNKVNYKEFDSIKKNIQELQNKLQSNEDLSVQIRDWKKEVLRIRNSSCARYEKESYITCMSKKAQDEKDAQNKLFELQKLLSK
ncbi:hypothetical protein NJ8700_05770 [Aggregatibacter aphrophilus NJ8700]|jgi:hypothetical protein|uniref:hypothetical protein n=1 Tax=Aggregatibacter aphrophilus TaxID=732 RepID=UPI0001AAE2D6|nr:hypothetical protein [Aggregatibacter aphrophilus]ACS97590.1 conserved hypothetical protein [Aggregatibacter aphrophilus NJ8700]AKS64927.1 hypothetical protein NJ8700_05770 [Aggregatibacter aphrophilus NJ8700]EHB90964.1 hypothetical protein HMPREF9335_00654 [Aggregatibacter aphrophilus F0387]